MGISALHPPAVHGVDATAVQVTAIRT
jgi:hypothetical protein